MGSARRGSNPLLCIILFSFIFFFAYNDWEYKQLSLLAFVFLTTFRPMRLIPSTTTPVSIATTSRFVYLSYIFLLDTSSVVPDADRDCLFLLLRRI